MLLDEAREARKRAHCPYSNHAVGAVVLTDNGQTHRGCNIEVRGRLTSVHAEMLAAFVAVCDNDNEFDTIACTEMACGPCVHTLAEFADRDTRFVTPDGEWTLGDLIGDLYWPGEH
jgi:cytidine deaminase